MGAFEYSPRHAPDITIINPMGDGKHIIIDVTCIRPWVVSQSHHGSSSEALIAAEDRKRLVYGDVSPHTLVPFAVDLYGGIGRAAVEFLRMCQNQRQQDREHASLPLPWNISWSESWQQRLSIMLARAIARVIRQRASESFSRAVAVSGHSDMGPLPDDGGRMFGPDEGPSAGELHARYTVTVGHRHLDAPLPGDYCIDRGTVFGNPFLLRNAGDDPEGRRVCMAFRRVLVDPFGADFATIARSFSPPLDFDARLATESARRALVDGMRRLRPRVFDGAPLRLMCACLTPGRHVSCHANTIAIFLMDPLPGEEPMSPPGD